LHPQRLQILEGVDGEGGGFILAGAGRHLEAVRDTRRDRERGGEDAPVGETIAYNVYVKGYMDVRDYKLAPAEATEVTITLKRPQVISGRVVDADTRQPISKFEIHKGFVNRQGDIAFWASVPQLRGRGGAYRWEITRPPNSPYSRYRAVAEGYQEAVSDPVPYAEGEVTLDFELKPQNPRGP
ncbi:MAG: hypothetical protein GY953_41675, partial [bacterium]|nr:hypothetical protein [bacterium]